MPGNFHPLSADQVINARQQIDYVSTVKHYYGLAAPGTLASDPGWCIREATLDAQGRTVAIKFANGSSEYGAIWDSRAVYFYA